MEESHSSLKVIMITGFPFWLIFPFNNIYCYCDHHQWSQRAEIYLDFQKSPDVHLGLGNKRNKQAQFSWLRGKIQQRSSWSNFIQRKKVRHTYKHIKLSPQPKVSKDAHLNNWKKKNKSEKQIVTMLNLYNILSFENCSCKAGLWLVSTILKNIHNFNAISH